MPVAYVHMKGTVLQFLLKRLGMVVSSLVLVGCATAPVPISVEAASRIHRVAVISLTAKSLARKYVGLTVFGNENEEIDISDWKVDEQYERQLSEILVKIPGISVVDSAYSLPEFSHVDELNGPWDSLAFGGPNWGAIEVATKNYCSTNALDAVLIVAKTQSADYLGGTNQILRGAGIYVRGPGSRISVMHLISRVALLSCTEGKPIAVRPLAYIQDAIPGVVRRSAPTVELSEQVSRTPNSQWSREQKQQVRAALIALPQVAWELTVRSMFPTQDR